MQSLENRWRLAGMLPALGCGLMFWLTGCAMLAPAPPGGTAGTAAPARVPDEPTVSATVEPPAPVAPTPIPPPVTALPVAILFEGGAPAQAAIAARIEQGLTGPAYTVRSIDIDEPNTGDAFDSEFDTRAPVLAAVGPRALELAQQWFSGVEIVFCHVLEPAPEATVPLRARGVAPMPPPVLQFAAWAEVDPGLQRIGLITGDAFAALVPAAAQAAEQIGAELVHRISTSDRETLYRFRRLAPEIDGLWLAPDSEILSTAVILQILAYAAEHDVSVLVFSDSLLDHGGLISVTAPPDHVARAVIDAVGKIEADRAEQLPREIPLAEGNVRVNADVAVALGLPRLPRTEWVVRDQ